MGRRSWSLTTRVFASTAAIVAVVVGAALLIGSASLRGASDAAAKRGLEQSVDLVAQFLDGRQRSLAGGARVFVQAPYFRTLVAERRKDDLLDQAREAVEQLGAHWVMITDSRGIMLAKSDEPQAAGDSLGSVPLIEGALRGGTTTGFGVSRDSMLFQAVAVPIVLPGLQSIGVLVATQLVDSSFAVDVRAATASELVFAARDASGGLRVSTSTIGHDSSVASAIGSLGQRDDATTRPAIVIRGKDYFAQTASLTTAGGDPIGAFIVMHPRDVEPESIADVRRSLVIAAVIGFALALASAYFAARRVTRPVRAIATALRKAADGDYAGVAERVSPGSNDAEISSLNAAFRSLIADLRDKEALVAAVVSSSVAKSLAKTEKRVRRIALAKPARGGAMAAPGDVLAGRYRIDEQLGSGGMGIVYCATDLLLDESVAVKMLRPEILADAGAIDRLTEELRLSRRITHRNVVRMHDLGVSEGVPFLTMEYVQGTSLAAIIENRGRLPATTVVSIAKQLFRGLAVAHEQGVIHGDLKPQNVLVGSSGILKVADFGVARLIRRAVPRQRRAAQPDEIVSIARLSGAIIGTPEYMSPEVLLGEPASAASDIYAAGVVLHECLTGVTPYRADTPAAFIARKLDAPTSTAESRLAVTPRGEGGAIAEGLEELIAEMTRADADERRATAVELVERLEALDEAALEMADPVRE
jgi:HAMP domain-containing protein